MVDKHDMDLSKLLGDVYESSDDAQAPARPPRPATAEAPDWSDEAHLDKVFADWTPGPHESAPAAERNIVIDMPESPQRIDDDLAAALSAALADAGAPVNEPRVDLPDTGGNPAMPSVDLGVDLDVAPSHAPLAPLHDDPFGGPVSAAPLDDPMGDRFTTNDDPAVMDAASLMYVPDAAPVAPSAPRVWQRSDDDILPGKPAKAGRAPKAAKGPKVKAHKAPEAVAPVEAEAEAAPAKRKLFGFGKKG